MNVTSNLTQKATSHKRFHTGFCRVTNKIGDFVLLCFGVHTKIFNKIAIVVILFMVKMQN